MRPLEDGIRLAPRETPTVLNLTLNINPMNLRTAQHKGVRRVRTGGRDVLIHYTNKDVEASREALKRAIRNAAPVITRPPDASCPWLFRVEYVYRPKTLPKRLAGSLKITRPDGDNLTKDLRDCISAVGIAWRDDSQSHCAGEYRRYARAGEPAHIKLILRQLPATAHLEEEVEDC